MTDQPITRRSLSKPLAAVQSPAMDQAAAPHTTEAVAAANKFDSIPVPAAELARLQAHQEVEKPKRERGPKRDQPFSVKLRLETTRYIYEQANSRNVPIAQVIEEMAEAHAAATGQGRGLIHGG